VEKKVRDVSSLFETTLYRYSQTVSRISQQHLLRFNQYQSTSAGSLPRACQWPYSRVRMPITSCHSVSLCSNAGNACTCTGKTTHFALHFPPLPGAGASPRVQRANLCLVFAPFGSSTTYCIIAVCACRLSPPQIRVWTTRTRNTGQITLKGIQKSISRIACASYKKKGTTLMVRHTIRRI